MEQIRLIPDFVKGYYDEKSIKAVPSSWNRKNGYDWIFYLTSFYGESIFSKNLNVIKNYLGIHNSDYLVDTTRIYSNPTEFVQSLGILDVEHELKSNAYGSSILFKDKDSAIRFVNQLNLRLEKEYEDIESRVRLNILIGGENEKDYEASNVIVVSKNLLGHFNSEYKINYFFRTLEIVSVERQSSHAIEANVKFYTEICGQCHLCGRGLDDDFSRSVGIGPVCCRTKLKIKNIDDIVEVSNKIKLFAEKIGTIGPILIPKAQIVKLKK